MTKQLEDYPELKEKLKVTLEYDSEGDLSCNLHETKNLVLSMQAKIDELTEQLNSKWISVEDRLPEIEDNSVLAGCVESTRKNGWPTGGIDMVHIEDYFKDITDGIDSNGNQKYTKWYITQGVTHWMPLPKLNKESK